MIISNYILMILLLAVEYCNSSKVRDMKNEENLIRHLLANSSNVVRPVINRDRNMTVMIGLELIQLITLAEYEQSLTCKFWIKLTWTNELMTWNESEWGGTKSAHINPWNVWTPDIILYNSLEDGIARGTEEYGTPIAISSNGKSVWLAPVTFKSSCTINVAHFPFDDQKCFLKLGSWTLNSRKVNLAVEKKPIISTNYVPSPEWDISSIKKVKNTVNYNIGGTIYPYDDVTVHLEISRKSLAYLFYMVTPCLLLVVTTLFSFSLPPESKAKIVVIITNLLAFFVFLTMTNEILPKGSDAIPTISAFYLVLMIECVATLLMACTVMTTYHSGTQLNPPNIPECARKVIDQFCSVLSRKTPFESTGTVQPVLSHVSNTIQLITRAIHQYGGETGGKTATSKFNMEHRRPNSLFGSNTDIYAQNGGSRSSSEYSSVKVKEEKMQDEETLKYIQNEIHFLVESKEELDKRNILQNDWKYLAHVMDKVYYWVFILCSALSSAYILGSAYLERIKYSGKQNGGVVM